MGNSKVMKTGKCLTEGCKRKSREGRKECTKCSYVRLRDTDPVKFAFIALKNNAKRRKKEFTITLEEFKDFCIKTKYMAGKGRTVDSYTIDRIDQEKGYHIDNIQIMTNIENVKKYLEYRWGGDRMEFTTLKVETNTGPTDDCPF